VEALARRDLPLFRCRWLHRRPTHPCHGALTHASRIIAAHADDHVSHFIFSQSIVPGLSCLSLREQKKKMARFTSFRFLVIFALALSSSLLRPVIAQDGETVAEKVEGVVEDVTETVMGGAEDAADAVADAIPEDMDDVVADVTETFEDIVESVTSSGESPIEKVKSAVASLKDTIVSKSKDVVNKIKGIDKATAKKVAAGAIGVWGVSVAVGFLTKGDAAPETAPAKKGKFR
jgi:ElaB/YqjD/DUF883 family membrane-anchored ribosome-binding protein